MERKKSKVPRCWEGCWALSSEGEWGWGLQDPAGTHGPGAWGGESIPSPKPAATHLKLQGNRDRGGPAHPSSGFRGKLDCLKEKNYPGVSSRQLSPGQQPAERLGVKCSPCPPRWAMKGFVEQPPLHPPGQGDPPHAARLPRCLCQAPTNGPRHPASSHFCAQGPLSPARERNVAMSNTRTRGHLCNGGRARTSDPSIPPSHPCDAFPHQQEQRVYLFLFLKVYFQGLGLPESQVRGWSRAGTRCGDGCHQLWALMSGREVPVVRSKTSSLGRLLSERGFGLLNE